jgi:photosystem II stability/assembly factor-like uncharacterized protein
MRLKFAKKHQILIYKNKFMKNIYQIFAIFALCGLFFSCKKDFVQSKFELILLEGDNQLGEPNKPLEKEIILAVLRDGKPFFSAPIEVTANSGTIKFTNPAGVLQNVNPTDTNGRLRLSWTLGCVGDQELTVKLHSPGCSVIELNAGTCLPLQEIKVKASANSQTGWTKVCGLNNLTFFASGSSRFFEFGNDVFLLNNNNIFGSSNGGLDWEALNTPFGVAVGFTSAFTVDTVGNWYIAMFSNGVFKSTDRGLSWTNISINSFFQQPRNLKVVGNTIFLVDPGNGLFSSPNNGASWQQVVVGNNLFGNYSEIVQASDGKLWLWDYDNARFAKSSDSGLFWTTQNISSNLTAFPLAFLTPTNDNHLLYLYENGAKFINYNTATNSGTTKNFAVSPTNASRISYLNVFNQKIFVVVYDNINNAFVYSDEGTGSTFTKIDLGTTETPTEFFITKSGRFLIGNSNGLFAKIN